MAINETITLTGTPQVKEQLAQVQAESVKTSAAINSIGAEGAAGVGIQNVFVQLKAGTQEMKGTTSAAQDLRLGVRALKPELAELGVAMGPVGSFARVAAANFGLFAAAFTGFVVINLTKFNEQLAITKDRLDSLTRGPSAFALTETEAKRLGVSIESLAPAVESFTKAWQAAAAASTVKFVGDVPPGAINNLNNGVKFATALVAQFRAAGLGADEASKATAAFGDQLAKTGTITGDMLRKVQDASPRVAQSIATLFGQDNVQKFIAELDKVPLQMNKINLTVSTGKFTQFADPKPVTALIGQLIELGRTFEGLKGQVSPVVDQWSTDFLRGLNFIIQHSDQLSVAVKESLGKSFSTLDPTQLTTALNNALKAVGVDTTAIQKKLEKLFSELDPTELTKVLNKGIENVNWDPLLSSFKTVFDKIQKLFSELQTPTAPGDLGSEFQFGAPPGTPGAPASANKTLQDTISATQRITTDFNLLNTSATLLNNAWLESVSSAIGISAGFNKLQQSSTAAAASVATFNDRFNAVNASIDKSGFVNAPSGTQAPPGSKFAPAAGQFGIPSGSVFAPGGAGGLTQEQLIQHIQSGADIQSGTNAPTLMPNVKLFDQANVDDQAKIIAESAAEEIDQTFAQFDFTGLVQSLGDVGATASQRIQQAFQDLNFDSVTSAVGQMTNSLQEAANVNFSSMASQLQQVGSAAQQAASSVQQLSTASQQVGGFGFSGTPLASGGLVTGPGTGTSDSIMARLSAGEFIVTAAATRHWGARFLSALNNMRMPTLMPQSTLIPRFAEGGPVSASRPIHLHLGGEAFAMNASENVASALRKHAVKSRLLSTGRKPSWY